ncbi:ClpP family protease [Chitinivibrio alkaliphilus]|uniref:ATP-dependent Clp protease proteolytic subunit n=1 Tax=Chitinivibrio alkaliphilus ACht1 TaxID=1313304 RepID=U7D9E6_9BACT|nr:ATP-dependent Clp protease proteolytic subunit [Chitinivibrio alkaliphilus]ERP31030.1 Endopeptidase Clp [Chitinivibrio alkaliphilus ACht1]
MSENEMQNKNSVQNKIDEQFIAKRNIFLWDAVTDETSKDVVERILYLDSISQEEITLYINSPGGSISAGLAIYDAMQFAQSDIRTVCMGQAASMGAVLLCAGEPGKRDVWEHARVMIHQPLISGNMYGPASDIEIQADEMLRIRDVLNTILSRHTGVAITQIEKDTDRDKFLSAEESVDYGLADHVIKK